jgi:hypothetical protein
VPFRSSGNWRLLVLQRNGTKSVPYRNRLRVTDSTSQNPSGKIEGEIKLIRTLQGILRVPVSEEEELRGMTFLQLEALTGNFRDEIRNRPSS